MDTIYKYPLEVTGEQTIELPLFSKPLSVHMQNGVPCLWAIVDPSADKAKLTIHIYGTGQSIENAYLHKYISTFQMEGGSLVFHAFEGQWTRES